VPLTSCEIMPHFHWLILQEGQLPLRPDHRITRVEHRPTITLLWREGEPLSRDNSVLVDPYFTENGYLSAQRALQRTEARFSALGSYFVTHPHYDHLLHLPPHVPQLPLRELSEPPQGIDAVPCPGHAPHLRALAFTALNDERVWVVSDAILDEEWLRAWGYYYPNSYGRDEVMQTWRSIAKIFADADVIVPGHGAPIRVTRALVTALIAGFPKSEYSSDCPDVLDVLQKRVESLA
jgi:glyoxylase-like metal-dependent hydrolase (beta-lactamase superfamily II)